LSSIRHGSALQSTAFLTNQKWSPVIMNTRIAGLLGLAALVVCSQVNAQALLDEVHSVGSTDSAVPIENTFTIANPGTYEVTLTDLGAQLPTPAPVVSVRLAVTRGSAVVGTPIKAAGKLRFDATAGSYVARVVGTPDNKSGSTPILVEVRSVADGTLVYSSGVEALQLPAQAVPASSAVMDTTFTVSAGDPGNYVFTLSDLRLPQPLPGGVTAVLVAQNGTGTPTVLQPPQAPNFTRQANLVLAPGTYRVTAVADAAGSTPGPNPAGLFSVTVGAVGGALVVNRTTPVGLVRNLGSVSLNAGPHLLSLGDLGFPAALTQKGAVVVGDGQVLATAPAATPGDVAFTAATKTYQVFGVGIAASGAAGSYAVAVRPQGGSALLSAYQAVTDSAYSAAGYAFSADIATAGSYQVRLTDYQFPLMLASATLVLAQGSSTVGAPVNVGAASPVSLVAGKVGILVFAKAGTPQTTTQGGIFGVDLTPAGGTNAAFAVTQGIGGLFTSRKVSVTTPGRYDVNLTDLAFPAAFTDLDAVVTRGTQTVGSIFGSGKFSIDATAGDYFINFVAHANSTEKAGTYALNVAPSPPAPVVTLSASAASVASGGTVTLTWSSQNATSCTASGAWSGTQATSGSATSAAITASSTFTLKCDGGGGSDTKTVTVGITPPSSGGGGPLDWLTAIALAGALRLRWTSARGP
jgi:hypothetical protein